MHKTEYSKQFLIDLGKLVQQARAVTMDQSELALRAGVSRATVSKIERGCPVSSLMLVEVLGRLGLLPQFHQLTDRLLEIKDSGLTRKSRKEQESISNDF